MKNNNVKRMTGIALLMALVVVMQAIGGMLPPIGGFAISLVLIPIVLGSALYGPGVGALLGATFGVVTYVNCITGADPGGAMVFQANPFLCFLVVMGKSMLAGFLAGLVYKLVSKKNRYAAMMLASITCPVVNTGTFVLCMVLFFNKVLASWAGGENIIGYIFTGIILINFLPELIINVVFSPAGQRIADMLNKRK